MENQIIVGVILKPHGIRGELKVKNLTDGFSVVSGLKSVTIDGTVYKVLKIREAQGDLYFALSGLLDRNSAELMRNKEVYALRSDVRLPEGRYFISDVLGSKVVLSDGTVIGNVKDITSARTDIYYVDCVDGRKCCFPLLPDLLVSIDVEAKTVTLNSKRFSEVTMYED